MLQRRNGGALSVGTQDDDNQALIPKSSSSIVSSSTKTNGFKSIASGAAVLLLVGTYMTTLDSSSSSSSSLSNKSSLKHSSLRNSSPKSHILPNFQPIHPQCQFWSTNDARRRQDLSALFLTLCTCLLTKRRFRLDRPLFAQGLCRLWRVYDARLGQGRAHYWTPRRCRRAH